MAKMPARQALAVARLADAPRPGAGDRAPELDEAVLRPLLVALAAVQEAVGPQVPAPGHPGNRLELVPRHRDVVPRSAVVEPALQVGVDDQQRDLPREVASVLHLVLVGDLGLAGADRQNGVVLDAPEARHEVRVDRVADNLAKEVGLEPDVADCLAELPHVDASLREEVGSEAVVVLLELVDQRRKHDVVHLRLDLGQLKSVRYLEVNERVEVRVFLHELDQRPE
jgi:hypothetical protein